MPAKIDYKGTVKVMNNGQKAEVIEYINSNNMTIRFEDETVVRNVKKAHFDNGKVSNPKFNSHADTKIGEVRLMRNGMIAEIIDYIDYNNITVKFEDNSIVYNRRYAHFLAGRISNRSKDYSGHKVSCKDETRVMNCGLKAKCIEYKDANHITLQFEDGEVVTNKTKSAFYSGAILHPKINKSYYCNKATEYMDMRKQMNCGEFCTIVDYKSVDNITVKFDSGEIVYNRTMNQFKLGAIDSSRANLNFRSLPQMLCYLYLKYYFRDAKMNFRPNWLKNNDTGISFELDVYIPQLKVALEYDGLNTIHIEKTHIEDKKYKTIYSSNYINKIIVIREDGCISHENNHKLTEYTIGNQYNYGNYNLYLSEILRAIVRVLTNLGVSDNNLSNIVSLDRLMSKADNKGYYYTEIKNRVIDLILKLETI